MAIAKFDTLVQQLKYRVLKEVAKDYWDGTLQEKINDIPKVIAPGPKASVPISRTSKISVNPKRMGRYPFLTIRWAFRRPQYTAYRGRDASAAAFLDCAAGAGYATIGISFPKDSLKVHTSSHFSYYDRIITK